MNNVPWEMIINRLEKVGLEVTKGAKTGIEFIYPLAIKQVFIKGFIWLIIGVILSISIYKMTKWAKNNELTEINSYGEEEDYTGIVYLLSILLTAPNILIYNYAIPRLLNSQWYAIQKLIEMLK